MQDTIFNNDEYILQGTAFIGEYISQTTVFGNDEYIKQNTGFSTQVIPQNTIFNDEYVNTVNK